MYTIEFHASEGGADSEDFIAEFSGAVAKSLGTSANKNGRIWTVESLERL